MTGAQRLGAVMAACIALGVAIWLLWSFDPFGRRKRAVERGDAAVAGEKLATATTRITERTFHTETILREQADVAETEIAAQAGADTPLPDDVRGAHLRGIEQLRNEAPGADDPRPGGIGSVLPPTLY